MNRLFLEILPFGVALQITCYIFWAFNIFGSSLQYPLGDVNSIQSVFSVDVFSVLLGLGGAAIIGVAALLFRPNTYAIYAMLLFALGCAFKVVQTFFLAIPNFIAALIPVETNPSVTAFPIHPFIVVITVIVGYAAFWWLFSLVLQRDT